MDTFTFYEESLHATQAAQLPFITALVQGRARGGASGSRRHGALPGASPSHRSARPTAEDLRRDRADAPGIAARIPWGHALDAVVVLAEELEVTARVERCTSERGGASVTGAGVLQAWFLAPLFGHARARLPHHRRGSRHVLGVPLPALDQSFQTPKGYLRRMHGVPRLSRRKQGDRED